MLTLVLKHATLSRVLPRKFTSSLLTISQNFVFGMTTEHKYLPPEQYEGTDDVLSYITQLEHLSSLKEWLKRVIGRTSGNPVMDGGGNPTYADKRHLIFSL